MFIVVNPQDKELGRGFEKNGIQKWVKDYIMILDDHEDYRIKVYELKARTLLSADGKKLHDAVFQRLATPEDFIKED